jgi:lysophospholipase L1-like esterase
MNRFRQFGIALAATVLVAAKADAQRSGPPRWIATWSPSLISAGARPTDGTPDRVPTYVNTTIRQIIHTTVGGDRLRVRLSNEYGDRPIVIGSVHVALRARGAETMPESDRAITFGGEGRVTVRAGATVTSDAIDFPVPALGDLAVSLFLPDSARTTTRHALAVQTTFVSKAGDRTASRTIVADTTLLSWVFLAGVDVANGNATGAIVTFGNSITDGFRSTVDENHRWPDVLASRLLSASNEPMKGVVNAGISGNRVLTFGAGPSALARFDRDVLMVPGVTHVIVLEGINDISRSDATAGDAASAGDIIFGLRQLIERAHERGLVIYGATLTAFERAGPEREAKRQAVNAWIRTGGDRKTRRCRPSRRSFRGRRP